MEILEEDVEIAENQISFDFLKSGDTEKQTEKNSVWKKEDTLVVVMRADEKISSNFDICGKKMLDWVTLACSGCETKVIDEVAEENLLSALLPYAEKYAYVCVLFSDTPLLKRSTFIEIMDFFVSHDLRFLRLKKGYVFKREFLQSARKKKTLVTRILKLLMTLKNFPMLLRCLSKEFWTITSQMALFSLAKTPFLLMQMWKLKAER